MAYFIRCKCLKSFLYQAVTQQSAVCLPSHLPRSQTENAETEETENKIHSAAAALYQTACERLIWVIFTTATDMDFKFI